MKKYLLSLATVLMTVLLIGCSEDDPKVAPQPVIEPATVEVVAGTATDASISFNITTTNAEKATYKVFAKGERDVISADDLKDGVTVATNQTVTITVNELSEQTTYEVYAAAANSADEWVISKKVEMTTLKGGEEPQPEPIPGEEITFTIGTYSQTYADGIYTFTFEDTTTGNNAVLGFHNWSNNNTFYVAEDVNDAMAITGDSADDVKFVIADGQTSYITYEGVRYNVVADHSTKYSVGFLTMDEAGGTVTIIEIYVLAQSEAGVQNTFKITYTSNPDDVEIVETTRDLSGFDQIEILKNGNNFTVNISKFSGTFTINVATTDGVLCEDSYKDYSMEDGTITTARLNEADGMYSSAASLSFSIKKSNAEGTKYIYHIEGDGNCPGVFHTIYYTPSKGQDASLINYEDSAKPATAVNLDIKSFEFNSLPETNGSTAERTLKAIQDDNNYVYLHVNTDPYFAQYADFLPSSNYYYIVDSMNQSGIFNNWYTNPYWVDVTKSYAYINGERVDFVVNFYTNVLKVTTEMPSSDVNTLDFTCLSADYSKRINFTYSGAIGYAQSVQDITLKPNKYVYSTDGDAIAVTITDAEGTEIYLYGYDKNSRGFFKGTYYLVSSADEVTKFGFYNGWIDTTKSYITYKGEKYSFEANNSQYWFKTTTSMPTANINRLRLDAMTADGKKHFLMDVSDVAIENYPVQQVEATVIDFSTYGIDTTYTGDPEPVTADNYGVNYSIQIQDESLANGIQVNFVLRKGKSAPDSGVKYRFSAIDNGDEQGYVHANATTIVLNGKMYNPSTTDTDSYFMIDTDGTIRFSILSKDTAYRFNYNHK